MNQCRDAVRKQLLYALEQYKSGSVDDQEAIKALKTLVVTDDRTVDATAGIIEQHRRQAVQAAAEKGFGAQHPM